MSKRKELDRDKLFETISKCGFDFEFYVQNLLKKNKWQTINNRHYIDDVKRIEREMDIVAYKAKERNGIFYYTVLVVSCKHSKESAWVFLTQEKSPDINFDSSPLHIISSDFRLNSIIENERNMIVDKVMQDKVLQQLYTSTQRVFASVQVHEGSIQDEGNKAIYDSISTSIKAMEAEKDSHKDAKIDGKPTFYCFYALSVFNKPMYEMFYHDDTTKTINEVLEIKYVNRHIVNEKEQFYHVHFISKDHLEDAIQFYNDVYKQNIKLYSGLADSFYDTLWSNEYKINLLREDFMKSFLSTIRLFCHMDDDSEMPANLEIVDISFEHKDSQLSIQAYFNPVLSDDLINKLNKDERAVKWISGILKRYFHYEGYYVIGQDWLPF